MLSDKRDLANLQRQYDTVSERYATTKGKLADVVAELNVTKLQLDSLNRRVEAQRRTNDGLVAERAKQEREAQALRLHAHKVEAKLTVTAQQSGLAASIEKQARLEQALADRDAAAAVLEAQVAQLKQELSVTANALALKEEDWGVRPAGVRGPDAVHSLRGSLLRTVTALKHESDAFALQAREEERVNKALREEIRALKDVREAADLRCSAAVLRQEELAVDLEYASKALREHEALVASHEALRQESRQQAQALAGLRAKLEGATVDDLLDSLSALQDAHAKALDAGKAAADRCGALDAARADAEARCAALEARQAELQGTLRDQGSLLKSYEDKVAFLEASGDALAARNKELGACVQAADALHDRVRALEEDVSRLQLQKAHLQKVLVSSARGRAAGAAGGPAGATGVGAVGAVALSEYSATRDGLDTTVSPTALRPADGQLAIPGSV